MSSRVIVKSRCCGANSMTIRLIKVLFSTQTRGIVALPACTMGGAGNQSGFEYEILSTHYALTTTISRCIRFDVGIAMRYIYCKINMNPIRVDSYCCFWKNQSQLTQVYPPVYEQKLLFRKTIRLSKLPTTFAISCTTGEGDLLISPECPRVHSIVFGAQAHVHYRCH